MTCPPPSSLSLSLRSIKSMQYGRGMIPNPPSTPFPPSSWAASYSLLNRRVPRQLWKNGLEIRDFATLLACIPASSDSSITFKWPIVDRFVHVTVPYICIMHMALRLHLQKVPVRKKSLCCCCCCLSFRLLRGVSTKSSLWHSTFLDLRFVSRVESLSLVLIRNKKKRASAGRNYITGWLFRGVSVVSFSDDFFYFAWEPCTYNFNSWRVCRKGAYRLHFGSQKITAGAGGCFLSS